MQFIAQIALDDTIAVGLAGRRQRLLLFQCQNRPGLCDEWDPSGGGNAALLVSSVAAVSLTDPPVTSSSTLLAREDTIELRSYVESAPGHTRDDAYCDALDADPDVVLGKVGGRPLWLQSDETPLCACGARMRFVAQIEQHAGGGINFGDTGVGYAFVCDACPQSARFLFQCA
jgi:hypothetical protein